MFLIVLALVGIVLGAGYDLRYETSDAPGYPPAAAPRYPPTDAPRDDTGGSYHAETVNKDLATEVKRLHQQAILWWPKEKEYLLQNRLIRDGLRIADIGCGPGFLTEEILRDFPNSSVTGIELDPKLLAIAKQTNKKYGRRFSAVHASIDKMGQVSAGSFDLVILRYLVQHLPDPISALREVRRVTTRGGNIVVIDIDEQMSGVFAPGPSFGEGVDPQQMQAALALNQRIGKMFDYDENQKGGNRFVGRSLPKLLSMAGFKSPSMGAAIISTDEYGLEAFKKLLVPDARAWKFFRKGLLTEEQVKTNDDMLEAFFQDEKSQIIDLELIAHASNR